MSRFRSFSACASARSLALAPAGVAVGPVSRTGLALSRDALRLRRVADLRLVAVERVAELDAEAAERPLQSVRDRALDGRVVPVEGVLRHRVDADVGAGQGARHGDPHRGAVALFHLHLAGLGVDRLDPGAG